VWATGLHIFDFDNVIIRDSSQGGIFNTAYYLYPVKQATTHLLSDFAPDPNKLVKISAKDYYLLKKRSLLAANDAQPGSMAKFTLENGQEIIPGFYKLNTQMSYVDFADEAKLLATYNKVKKQAQYKWQGRGFKYLQALCETKEGAKTATFVTYRPLSLEKLFKAMVKDGYLKHMPNLELAQSLTSKDGARFSQFSDGLATRKANAVEQLILWANEFYTDKEIITPDGNSTAKMIPVHFFEDDSANLDAAVKKMERLSTGRASRVKMVVHNMGHYPIEEVRKVVQKSGNIRIEHDISVPQVFVIDNGFRRGFDRMKPQELVGEGILGSKIIKKLNKFFKSLLCGEIFIPVKL
jgi:hypothetical protein